MASGVAQRSKALHRSANGVTTDPGLIPGCITTSRDPESHSAAHNWPSFGHLKSSVERSSVERCFLRHIGAAGYRVTRASVKKCVLADHVSRGRIT